LSPVNAVSKGLPALYNTVASHLGFLTLTGGEILIPLDGQHRLKAIEFAITGRDEQSKDIEGLTPSSTLAQEDVAVLLVRYEPTKARKIFNKVNRYAKPTSKAQNLITDDDDVIAIITREIADKVIGGRLVNISTNSLSAKAPEFTTLATLYESIDYIVGSEHKVDKSKRPEKAKEKLFESEVSEIWNRLVTSIEAFSAALFNKEESGDEKRREIRSESLLGKPIGQLCLVRAYVDMKNRKKGDGSAYTEEDICRRLNTLDWSLDNPLWQGVLMHGDKVLSGKTAVSLASEIIAYLCGAYTPAEKAAELLARFKSSFPKEKQDDVELPKPVLAD